MQIVNCHFVIASKNKLLFQGNVGDSRAVASVRGVVEQLSYDHKPSNELEARRITAAGGFVEFNRVNGSRNIKYFFLKNFILYVINFEMLELEI